MSKLGKAIALAATAFENEDDQGGRPYILHCIRVMMRLRTDDDRLNIPAILHDVIEDKPEFGDHLDRLELTSGMLHTLDCLTHRKREPYTTYLGRISTDKWATMIKLSDLRDNSDITRLKGVTAKDHARIEKYNNAYHMLSMALERFND